MAPDIQAAHEIWPQLASIVFVAHTENDYHRLLDLQDDLTAIVSGSGNAARHPLASLLEVVRALIEKYEAAQDATAREEWYHFSMQMLARAYSDDEPEYTTDMLQWVNPDYEGK